MTAIHFQANFLKEVKKFKVEISTPERRFVELMSIARFLRFAKEIKTKPISIGGVIVNFKDDKDNLKEAVIDYFNEVSNSYKKYKGYIK